MEEKNRTKDMGTNFANLASASARARARSRHYAMILQETRKAVSEGRMVIRRTCLRCGGGYDVRHPTTPRPLCPRCARAEPQRLDCVRCGAPKLQKGERYRLPRGRVVPAHRGPKGKWVREHRAPLYAVSRGRSLFCADCFLIHDRVTNARDLRARELRHGRGHGAAGFTPEVVERLEAVAPDAVSTDPYGTFNFASSPSAMSEARTALAEQEALFAARRRKKQRAERKRKLVAAMLGV